MSSSRRRNRNAPKRPKQKGEKDRVPGQRKVKASIRAIIRDIVENEPLTVRSAIRRGINASPRDAHHYIKIAAEYLDGKPDQNLNLQFNEDELATAKDSLSRKLDMVLSHVTPKDE